MLNVIVETGITVLAVGLGAAAQTATGFGLALIAVPLLSLVMPPLKAVALGLLLPIPLNAFILIEAGMPRPTVSIVNLVRSSLVALPVGVYLLRVSPPAVVQVVIGALTLGLAVMAMSGRRFVDRPSKLTDSVVGALSGVASGATGMGGPLLGVVLLSRIGDKTSFRGILLVYLLLLNVCSFLALVVTTPVLPMVLPSLGVALPVLAAGVAIGRFVFRLLEVTSLRRLVLGLASSAGAIGLANGLAGLLRVW